MGEKLNNNLHLQAFPIKRGRYFSRQVWSPEEMTQIHKLSQMLYFQAMNVKCEIRCHSNQQRAMLDICT